MDRDLVIQLARLSSEIKTRRKKNRLLYYNRGEKVHQKQLAFHASQKKLRWVFGGNRSGKTECGAAETVFYARGIHPYRQNLSSVDAWVVSLSQQVQRDVAQKKVLDYLNPDWIADIVMISGSKSNPKNGVIDFIEVKNVSGDISRIGFKSCDQGREKFQGTSLDFVWFDEEPPEDIFDECRMRVFDKNGFIFGTMTPLKGLTFVYDKIYMAEAVDPDIECFNMEWADNPWLDGNEIARLSAIMSEEQLQTRRFGRFFSGSGLVYGEFDPSIHVIEPFAVPTEWYDNISIDPGLRNPLSAHWYAVDGDGTIFVIAEHYEAEKTIDYHAAQINRISDRLNWHRDKSGRLNALIDSAAGQHTLSSQKSVTELFYEHGIAANPRVNKHVFSGISRVKLLLSSNPPRLYIFKSCVNLIREFKSYWWGDGDSPKKSDDHALDELRYFVMSRPEPYMAAKPKSIIELDKEKRLKLLKRNN